MTPIMTLNSRINFIKTLILPLSLNDPVYEIIDSHNSIEYVVRLVSKFDKVLLFLCFRLQISGRLE